MRPVTNKVVVSHLDRMSLANALATFVTNQEGVFTSNRFPAWQMLYVVVKSGTERLLHGSLRGHILNSAFVFVPNTADPEIRGCGAGRSDGHGEAERVNDSVHPGARGPETERSSGCDV